MTFDGNGGIPECTEMFTDGEGRLASLPGASRQDYGFDGWYTDDGRKVAADEVYVRDTTLHARWTEIPVEGVELSRSDITVSRGTAFTLR